MSRGTDPMRATSFLEKKKRALVGNQYLISNFFLLQLKGKKSKLVSFRKIIIYHYIIK